MDQAKARRTRYRVTPRWAAMRRWLQPERLRRRARPSVDSMAHKSTRSGSSRAASTRARIDVVTCFSAVGCIATLDLRPRCSLTIASRVGLVSTRGEAGVKFGGPRCMSWAHLSRPGRSLRHPGQPLLTRAQVQRTCCSDRCAMAWTPWYDWARVGPGPAGAPPGALRRRGIDPRRGVGPRPPIALATSHFSTKIAHLKFSHQKVTP